MPTIILDTDIGTDVDDILALGLALCAPEIELAAVTVVYGDVDLRARMVAKTLAAAQRADVPIGRGSPSRSSVVEPSTGPGTKAAVCSTAARPRRPRPTRSSSSAASCARGRGRSRSCRSVP